MNKIIKELEEALNTDTQTKSYDTQAEVVRVEGSTLWVHIPGGVDETPVKKTINAKVGDTVQVRVGGGSAWLVGNQSAPPTDDARAIVAETTARTANENANIAAQAANSAVESAERASSAATRAEASANDALTAAQNAQTSADSALVSLSTVEDVVGVLNWITAHGTMTLTSDVAINPAHVYFVVNPTGDYVVGGTHYSIVAEPKVEDISTYYELSVDESVQNYVATHVVSDTEGLWLIPDSGGNKVLIATGAGSSYTTAGTYIIGKVSGVDTVFAKFLQTGTTVSSTNGTQIAHLGYGTGTSQSGTSTAPFYSLGVRGDGVGQVAVYDSTKTYSVGDLTRYNNALYRCKTAITTPEAFNSSHWGVPIGNYSVVEGYGNVASDYSSHSEGWGNVSEGLCSHTEGMNTHAKERAHAEGSSTDADGYASHSEGEGSNASGRCSHAQNLYTRAFGEAQTALGKYNVNDNTSAVIIGNGTANNARSNALTVDWSGNVNIASGAKYKINGTNLSASDVGALPISGGTMTGQLLTSFKSSVAMGSYGSAQTTVPNLVEEVRFSSGCCGSVSIGTAYTANNVTIATGWYNFMYMTHRSGGVNGSASGDNCNYGNLFLFGMNNTNGRFVVRVSSGSIAEVAKIFTSIERYTRSNAGDLAWTNQTDGDAKVIMKSALAFWNGAYNGTGSNLRYSANGEILGKNIVKDWVTAHGTSGNWTYRKWNSGQIEAWYSGSLALTNDGQLSSATPTWYRSHYAVTVPSAVGMTTIKTANCSNTSPASFHMQANTAISGLTITQYCIRGGGTLTGNVTANIYVTGV